MLPWPVSSTLVESSPMDHPLRSILIGIPVLYLSYVSLLFLRSVNAGTTITLLPRNPLLSLRVHSGNYSLSAKDKKIGVVKSYNGPIGTAFLGLLFYSAAQFLLVSLFKTVNYIF